MNRVFKLGTKALISTTAKLFGTNKLSILTYHRVGDSGHAISMDEKLFEQQLIWLKSYFKPIDLALGMQLQSKGCLPGRSIAITVDDGYADSYDVIFPLLKKHNLTATFFISTAGLDTGYLWDELVSYNIMNTQVQKIFFNEKYHILESKQAKEACLIHCLNEIKYHSVSERNVLIAQVLAQTKLTELCGQFLTREQILKMHQAGMGIGAHTHNHPILVKENSESALNEIRESKRILEEVIKEPIDYFAYPNGKFGQDFNQQHVSMVASLGFKAAFTTDFGVLGAKDDPLKIKRFTPWHEEEFKFASRLALNYC